MERTKRRERRANSGGLLTALMKGGADEEDSNDDIWGCGGGLGVITVLLDLEVDDATDDIDDDTEQARRLLAIVGFGSGGVVTPSFWLWLMLIFDTMLGCSCREPTPTPHMPLLSIDSGLPTPTSTNEHQTNLCI